MHAENRPNPTGRALSSEMRTVMVPHLLIRSNERNCRPGALSRDRKLFLKNTGTKAHPPEKIAASRTNSGIS